MNNDYRSLTEAVRNRLNPDHIAFNKSFSDELQTISYSNVLTYIRLAMKGVEPEYTQKSMLAGSRVKDHLLTVLDQVDFRYQGSVMTNTHIKSYSDIDLLTISSEFYQYDRYNSNQIINDYQTRAKYSNSQIEKIQNQINAPDYNNDSLSVLKNIRLRSERKLSSEYSICDISKPKSIKITNTNLRRDVDIVVANWYDDILSIVNSKGSYRGIQVYNKDTHSRGDADFPFLSIERISERGNLTTGRLKKMIRFLKNMKANSSHEIKLSSFDFNAICYDIAISEYHGLVFHQLVPVLYKQLKSIADNQSHADRVTSVDDREYIFRYNPEKIQNLRLLLAEVEGVYFDLQKQTAIY